MTKTTVMPIMPMECSECGWPISQPSIACPHCGAPYHIMKKMRTKIRGIFKKPQKNK